MRWLFVCCALLGCASRQAPVARPATSITTLDWLVGRWCGSFDDGAFCESWHNDHGALVGEGHFERTGARISSETLRIEARNDGMYYVATPEREPTTAFRMVRASDEEAVFENPQHDFPQRITYRRRGVDGLDVIVEGNERRIIFVLSRHTSP